MQYRSTTNVHYENYKSILYEPVHEISNNVAF